MGIEQHLVTLAWVRNQPECATGVQLHVGDLMRRNRPPISRPYSLAVHTISPTPNLFLSALPTLYRPFVQVKVIT